MNNIISHASTIIQNVSIYSILPSVCDPAAEMCSGATTPCGKMTRVNEFLSSRSPTPNCPLSFNPVAYVLRLLSSWLAIQILLANLGNLIPVW